MKKSFCKSLKKFFHKIVVISLKNLRRDIFISFYFLTTLIMSEFPYVCNQL